MIGIVLYEGFELLYYTGKLGYTLTKGIYSISKYYLSSYTNDTNNTNDTSENETNTIQNGSISIDNETYSLLLQKIEELEKEQKKLYSYIEELKDTSNTT